jgi:hypothetical protein
MKLSITRSIGLAASVLTFGACSSSTTITVADGGSATGASQQQISDCKAGCDKMKFFNCNDANELAACYSDCGTATGNQIDVFVACAQNSICDPACRTNITPAPSGSSSDGGAASSGPGATPSSCTSACAKLVDCNVIPVGYQDTCVTKCQQSAYQFQIDCVNNNVCGDLQSRCGAGGGGGVSIDAGSFDAAGPDFTVIQCQTECDALLSRQCISAAQQSTCRGLCSSSTQDKRSTFDACAQTAADCTTALSCYTTFGGT